jgi:hypothetical protein
MIQSVWCPAQERLQVPGTWVSMVPPSDFIPATRYRGFDHPPTKSSLLVSVINSSLGANLQALDSTRNPRMRMQILRVEELELVSGKARLFVMPEKGRKGDMIKQMLVLGDSLRTISISGFSPASDSAMALKIRSALTTVVYDVNNDANLLSVLPFSFVTGFSPAQLNGQSLLLTPDGSPVSDYSGSVMVAGVARIKRDSTDLKAYAVAQCMRIPGSDSSMTLDAVKTEQDSVAGFRISGASPARLLRALVLFGDDGRVYLIAGTCPASLGDTAKKFSQTFSSFRRRKGVDLSDN